MFWHQGSRNPLGASISAPGLIGAAAVGAATYGSTKYSPNSWKHPLDSAWGTHPSQLTVVQRAKRERSSEMRPGMIGSSRACGIMGVGEQGGLCRPARCSGTNIRGRPLVQPFTVVSRLKNWTALHKLLLRGAPRYVVYTSASSQPYKKQPPVFPFCAPRCFGRGRHAVLWGSTVSS